jgi:hypothetical protein
MLPSNHIHKCATVFSHTQTISIPMYSYITRYLLIQATAGITANQEI